MKRPAQLPRRFWRYPVRGSLVEQLRDLSPRQRWIAEQSTLRWEWRHNGGQKVDLMRGEVGEWRGVTIIPTAHAMEAMLEDTQAAIADGSLKPLWIGIDWGRP